MFMAVYGGFCVIMWLVLVEETGGFLGYERFTCGVTMKEPKYIGVVAPLRADISVLDMGY